MDNQHKMIKGYRDLSPEEIKLMNEVKEHGEDMNQLINRIKLIHGIDQRWLNIATTDLQKGFMSLVRAIAQPTTF